MENPSSCTEKIRSAVHGAQHPGPPDPALYQPTSVMGLFILNGAPSLLFIQKADVPGYPWRNQMAFPGGHQDKGDSNRLETALRELNEEVGILRENVEVLGSIGHYQTINHRDIQAFVGIWNQTDTIDFDPGEISRTLEVPLDHLIRLHRDRGYAGTTPDIMELTYPFEDVVIWGVTAKIIHHLLEILPTDP
ncbi:MAG: CoA pyrophosphatase [Desulfobacterales bacterium]|nr:CoA pyrophosphatase [Desulfobacterales bacterium]